jgi:hypothetical protein
VIRALTRELMADQGDPADLRSAWTDLRAVALDAASLLEQLVDWPIDGNSGQGRRPTTNQRRTQAHDELGHYLRFIRRTDPVAALLDLHVATRSMLPVLQEVDQRVELIQVSADTRTGLAPHFATAADKLTGLQVHHFGAFYKQAWRANDWMWGRLDGCGWLVHMLLDPRRIQTVLENDEVPPEHRIEVFLDRLGRALDLDVPADAKTELAFLADPDKPMPVSLPGLSVWAATALQRHIAAREMTTVAKTLAEPTDGWAPPTSLAARTWLDRVKQWSGRGTTRSCRNC